MTLVSKINSRLPYHWLPDGFAHWLTRLRTKNLSVVLLYHAVGESTDNPLTSGNIHDIPPRMFHDQLSLLKQFFTVISLDEMVSRLKQNQSTTGLAAITFDDGYLSVINQARPILEDLKIPATCFLITKLFESELFWRDKVRWVIQQNLVALFLDFAIKQNVAFKKIRSDHFYYDSKDPKRMNSKLMDAALDAFITIQKETYEFSNEKIYCDPLTIQSHKSDYLNFGNHSHSHYILSSLTPDEQANELETSTNALKQLNQPISKVFSIPFGGPEHYNTDTLKLFKEFGYECYALSNGQRVRSANTHHGLISLNRMMPTQKRWYLSNIG